MSHRCTPSSLVTTEQFLQPTCGDASGCLTAPSIPMCPPKSCPRCAEERGINCNRVFSYTGATLQRSARARGKETHQRIKRLLRFSGAQQGKGEGCHKLENDRPLLLS